ncbi:acyltransferase [uncultured Rikenella sp.]|uniref:acyltransferase n=1 Tax=uncultured Rikenella sp. TaxID=368003 RepID=UPI00260BC29D|nr:acyltransferase [uncultured Rikenella sp.]
MGDNFAVHTSIKIICFNNIIFGKNVLIGWEVFIMDTAFHSIVDKKTGEDVGEVSAPIIIGDNCWIGSKVDILKGARLPNNCIVGFGSLLTKDYGFPEYCVVAGNPPKVIKMGVYRDPER